MFVNENASLAAGDYAATQSGYVIGIDVGGTFTDAVCSDGQTTWRAKSPTNPARFSDGVMGACSMLAEHAGLTPAQLMRRVTRFGLGTTAVTNVLATRRGRTVGLLTTKGFENHLHAMRNHRDVREGWIEKFWMPVEPEAVRGIEERIDRAGEIIRPLVAGDLVAAAQDMITHNGVNALAVSFLWSFRNPAHEQQAVALLREHFPQIPVYSGADLHPIMREYERTTLAVLNAFAADALDGVEELEEQLRALGLQCPMLLLHSGGGAISAQEARQTPLALASSGPAAGSVAAGEVAMKVGLPDAICCDMGGTSIDVAVVTNGVPERRHTAELGGIVIGQSAIDVESVGAGGGSIAWIDDRGLLRVGPQSARATPGPVCYGRGGTEPTVTDAMVLLGYIDPELFNRGGMQLDVEGARAACARVGERLGMDAMAVAHGIREIALAEMSKAMRARISSGGLDTRRYGVIAFGGSGSLFATAMAKELDLPWVLTPALASVLSAYGAATADIRRERSRAVDQFLPLKNNDAYETLRELIERAEEDLAAQDVEPNSRSVHCEAEVRFHRQNASLTLTLEKEELDSQGLLQGFKDSYIRQFGASSITAKTPIELSTLRVTGIGKTIRAVLPQSLDQVEDANLVPISHRDVYLQPDAPTNVPVFAAADFRVGHRLSGPALVDVGDTTLWAPDGSVVELIAGGTLKTTIR
ncbi:hydantoinase/oxoprolinase family protein [Sphingobium sp. CR2-8]|uniref:hydantoinase/oxoprolinase family protein n=1 Tax=Sphingobium sp. CR2-8 TaxID=1306534 RepID=UPI002DB919C2|nr:hydantoinase/oxoprolinase family protein [Sphingobium sp. CR2-8]MEC3909527.1 hydantoinase/oxoprolinase family protein [Sphingobium sp. CR2-8]